jgi:hypothetical protein
MRNASWIALLVVAVAGSAGAQAASIDPGMTREQVVARLGKPISEHSSGASTYLYYSNGDEKKYGMHDMVAIENGKVVDAVFRSSARKYSGRSSSPAAVPAEVAIAKGHGGRAPRKSAPVETKPLPPVKAAPPSKAPPMTKAVPPTARLNEPKHGVDPRKIEGPKKSSDTTKKPTIMKKPTPAPTKRP